MESWLRGMRVKVPSVRLSRFGIVLLVILIAVMASGCSDFGGAQNTFSPEGPVANRQRDLFQLVLWPAFAIFVLVEGLCVYMAIRFRQRKGDDTIPRQVHGNTLMELGWTIAPVILLAIIAVPTLTGIVDLARDPSKDSLPVAVTGFQWKWQFAYPDIKDANGKPISELGTLHIPAGREIGVQLSSPDVIHSFWVPKLAGKTDVIPGRMNHMWLKADHPGEYSGQCAEFCGGSSSDGHPNMRFTVVVLSDEDFQAWAQSKMAESSGSGGDLKLASTE